MIDTFTIPVQITDNRTVNCYELKNKQFFNLLKFIQNQDFNTLSIFFENLIYELLVDKSEFTNLNIIDKLIILINIRSICISPDIEFESLKKLKFNKKISLTTIYKKFEQITFKTESIIQKDLTCIFCIPKKLYYNSVDNLVESCIDKINLNSDVISLNECNEIEKKQILETLPGSIFVEAKAFLDKLEIYLNSFIIVKEDEHFDFKTLELSLIKNTGFGFITSIFKDNLLNFYNLIYVFGNKLSMSPSEFFELTPAESSLLLSFYIKEQEEIKKASEQKGVPIGKKVDN